LSIVADAAELLPVEAFARLPDVTQAKLSPDGKKVVALAKIGKAREMLGTAVSVYDLETGESSVVTYGETGKFVIN
jgi:tricorn protease-like protein